MNNPDQAERETEKAIEDMAGLYNEALKEAQTFAFNFLASLGKESMSGTMLTQLITALTPMIVAWKSSKSS